MSLTHEIAIVGLGAMGSAAACHLAARGRSVLGLDAFAPPHTLGSSHGKSRIIREAYFEHPAYVPLVQRAYELWARLEQDSGERLFQPTGGLMIGAPESAVYQGALASARQHQLPHEILDAATVHRRFPAISPAPDMMAVWEPRAGILFPERCVTAHLDLARRHGADLHVEEPLLRWEPSGPGLALETSRNRYQVRHLVLAAGPWISGLLPGIQFSRTFQVERQVQFWFDATRDADRFVPDRCPIHLWEHEPGCHWYGFPNLGDGIKAAGHHQGVVTRPEQVRRDIDPSEVEALRQLLRRFLPAADGPLRASAVCLYTNTPDGHFLVDRHPAHRAVWVVSPCSGHGFKFASALGEAVADCLEGKPSRVDGELFRWRDRCSLA